MKAMSYYNKAKAPLQVAGELLSQTIALFRSAMLLSPYSSSRIASISFRFAIGAPSVQCNSITFHSISYIFAAATGTWFIAADFSAVPYAINHSGHEVCHFIGACPLFDHKRVELDI